MLSGAGVGLGFLVDGVRLRVGVLSTSGFLFFGVGETCRNGVGDRRGGVGVCGIGVRFQGVGLSVDGGGVGVCGIGVRFQGVGV